MTLESIFLETIVDAQILERETIGQDKNKLWLTEMLKRITSSQAHKVFIWKKNFETLANSFTEEKKLPKFVQDVMQHGKENESVAKQKFFDYMTYMLK